MKENKIAENKQENKIEERVLLIRRVSKKIPGGNYVSFSALVAVGDKNGRVGIGLGRSLEVPPAIEKAINYAKKHMINVPVYKNTLPHEIKIKFKSAKILLKPAPEGTGLKVGSVVRAILELAGVSNASGKILGSRNQIVNSYGVIEALKRLKRREK
jgi:small subunit ribosomal protein S5